MFGIYYVLIILFAYLIINSRGADRIVWYFAAIFLIPANVSIFPFFQFFVGHSLFVSCFCISMFRNHELSLKSFLNTPMSIPLVLLMISYLFIGIMDDRLSIYNGFYRGLYTFFGSYFCFFIGWFGLQDLTEDDKQYCMRKLLKISLIFTIYGLITFVMRSNPILDAVRTSEKLYEHIVNDSFRSFRVKSFTVSPSVYAFTTGLFAFISYVWLNDKRLIDRIAIGLLILNCILSATRAGMFPALLLFPLYCMFSSKVNFNNYIRFGLVAALLSTIAIIFIPDTFNRAVDEYSDMIWSSIDGSDSREIDGSTRELRDRQMSAAMVYLSDKPWFGHGIAYYQENVLSVSGRNEDLSGMESYICFLGVEYGGVNIVFVLYFYIYLFFLFYKNRVNDTDSVMAYIFILACFILYLCYAWVSGVWYYVMPILGIMCCSVYKKTFEMTVIYDEE